MRAKMLRVKAPANAIDIVGTGGDGSGSLNVSTLAAIITAACGVPVAKHGNRAASSKSGAADALMALGVKVGLPPEGVERCIAAAGIGFMMAPAHHAAMRHVGPTRVELGTRTIFNLLGPLSNPAGVKRQVVGVFSSTAWLRPMAEVLRNLGSERVWITNGGDGLDEITTTTATSVVELAGRRNPRFRGEARRRRSIARQPGRLRGGDPAHNAAALMRVLEGERSAYRDIAVFNAAAGLVVADGARDLAEGVEMAEAALDNGARPRYARSTCQGVKCMIDSAMSDILKKIEAYKRREIADAKVRVPRGTLEREIRDQSPRAASSRRRARPGGGPLRADRGNQEGEPVKGPHLRHFEPQALAKAYQRGGACVFPF